MVAATVTPIRDEQDPKAQARLHAALAKAILQTHEVEKDARNKFHGYNYASAEAVYRAAREALAANGLALVPTTTRIRPSREDEMFWAPGATKQDPPVWTRIGLVLVRAYVLVHEGGGALDLGEQEWPIVPERGRPEDKAVAAADTASLSYRLRDLLQLPRVEEGTEMDDERREHRGPARAGPTDEEIAAVLAAVSTAKPAEIQGHDKASHTLGPIWGPRVRAYCRARYLVATGKGMSRLPDDMQAPLAEVRAFMAERGIPDRIHDEPPPGPPGGDGGSPSEKEKGDEKPAPEKADPLDRQRKLAACLGNLDTIQMTQPALALYLKASEADVGSATPEWGVLDAFVGVLSEAAFKGVAPDKVRRKSPVKELVEEAKRIRVGTCGLAPFPPMPAHEAISPEERRAAQEDREFAREVNDAE